MIEKNLHYLKGSTLTQNFMTHRTSVPKSTAHMLISGLDLTTVKKVSTNAKNFARSRQSCRSKFLRSPVIDSNKCVMTLTILSNCLMIFLIIQLWIQVTEWNKCSISVLEILKNSLEKLKNRQSLNNVTASCFKQEEISQKSVESDV